jgi:mannose-6-phosphate isomerase
MGTHPKSPSRVFASNQLLAEHLAAHPSLVGRTVIRRFGTDGSLPFLFKVLAIKKALSIQIHPDKNTAEKLRAAQPDIYKGASIVMFFIHLSLLSTIY